MTLNPKQRLWINRIGMILLLIALVYFLEEWGIIGFLIFILAITARKAWFYRENFILNLKNLEAVVWGKPLDKELWEKGELKNTKVVVTWKKRKQKKSTSK